MSTLETPLFASSAAAIPVPPVTEPTTKRILHVFGRMARGGAEMRTLDIMRRVNRSAFALDYCVLSGMPGELDDEIRTRGGVVHYCRLGPAFPWTFRHLLRDGHYDCIHSHIHWLSGLILRLAAQADVPLRMIHFRSTESGRSNSLRYRLQNRLMRRWIDHYATHILSNGVSSLSLGWDAQWERDSRCAVIHNGLDTAPFHRHVDPDEVRREFGWPGDATLIIHVGRMEPMKNHSRLLEMLLPLLHANPQVHLLLAGRDHPHITPALQERVARTTVANRVAFAGTRSDVPRLLKAADLMVFPSIYEGLPGAVLEACAAGVPVLASDLPGVREIAARLGRIQYLSLQESDQQWRAAVQTMLAAAPSAAPRVQALRDVEASVYNIDRCVQLHCAAWSGAAGHQLRNLYV